MGPGTIVRYTVLSLLASLIQSANILIFVPSLSFSHVQFNVNLARTIQESGHTVTVLLVLVDPSIHYNATDVEIIRVSAGVPFGYLPEILWQNPGPFEDSSPLNPRISTKLARVSNLFAAVCKTLSADKGLLDSLRDRKFDIGMLEQYDSCGVGIFYKIGVSRLMWLSATEFFTGQLEAKGITSPLSYTQVSLVTNGVIWSGIQKESEIFGKDIYKMLQNSDFVIGNTVSLLSNPAPTSQQVINVGGITVDYHDDLDTEWSIFADSGPFIIVTFGSIVKTSEMPQEMMDTFLDSFNSFANVTFLMKHEYLQGVSNSNVVYSQWVPQKHLLSHSNCRGIITHGGLTSIYEAIANARPMILMPLFADHYKNSALVTRHNLGIVIDKTTVTRGILTGSIEKILDDTSYTKRLSTFARVISQQRPASHREMLDYSIRQSMKTRKFQLRPKDEGIIADTYLYVIVGICVVSSVYMLT